MKITKVKHQNKRKIRRSQNFHLFRFYITLCSFINPYKFFPEKLVDHKCHSSGPVNVKIRKLRKRVVNVRKNISTPSCQPELHTSSLKSSFTLL